MSAKKSSKRLKKHLKNTQKVSSSTQVGKNADFYSSEDSAEKSSFDFGGMPDRKLKANLGCG